MTGRRRTDLAAIAASRTDQGRPEAGETALRSTPMRTSIDIEPETRRRLNAWAADAAHQLGRPQVPLAQLTRALWELLLSDARTEVAVIEKLRITQ